MPELFLAGRTSSRCGPNALFRRGLQHRRGLLTALRQTQERHAFRVRKGQPLFKHIFETLPYFYITDCGHGHSHLASDSAALLAIGTSRGHTAHATCTCCDDAAPMGADTRTRTTGERHVCKSCERPNAALPSPTRGALSGDRPQRSLARVQPGSYSCAQVLLWHMPVDIQQIRQQLQQI